MRFYLIISMLAIMPLASCVTSTQHPKKAPVAPSIARDRTVPQESAVSPRVFSTPTTEDHATPLLTSLPSRFSIVESAARLVGARMVSSQGTPIVYDCAGVTRAIFLEHGIDLYRGTLTDTKENGVRLIHNHVRRHGTLHRGPHVSPGDLVFFDNTWDFNRDGKVNDLLTHVGIVERLDPDGTVVFISRVARAVERYRMNLEHPHVHKTAQGHVLNDYIRRKLPTDQTHTPRLTGELFSSYGNLFTSPQGPRSPETPFSDSPNQEGTSISLSSELPEQ